MKKISLLISFILLTWSGSAGAADILGALEPEAPAWADANSFIFAGTGKGTKGCSKGKRYVKMTSGNVTAYGIFFHPVYQEGTGTITQVEFIFNPPVSIGQARAYAIKVGPIIGTRAPTHTQTIKAEAGNSCIGKGGKEERYTNDYIVEFFKASGGKYGRMRVYNDYIR